MNKSQKVVVVTGASQGIGATIVEAFRKLDYRIVATSRSIKPSDDEIHGALAAFNPIGRLGETSDIAEAILFLDAAPFITGEILHIDGGQSAGH